MDTKPDTNLGTIYTNFVLFIILLLSFVWTQTDLKDFTPHLVVLLIIFYLATHFKLAGKLKTHSLHSDMYLATAVVALLVFSTGSLSSPVFFLFYFLLFGASLLISTASSYVITLVASVLLATSLQVDIVSELFQIVSLFLIAPIAALFGKQYVKGLSDQNKINLLQADAEMIKDELLESKESGETQAKMVAGWNKALIKKPLTSIWQQVDELLILKNLPKEAYTKLATISKELQKVLKGADKISEETKDSN